MVVNVLVAMLHFVIPSKVLDTSVSQILLIMR